jgi:hypothetical protein
MGAFTYSQNMYGKEYKLVSDGKEVTAYIDSKQIFTATVGARIITDLDGKLISIFGIAEDGVDFSIAYEDKKIEKHLLANDCIKEF